MMELETHQNDNQQLMCNSVYLSIVYRTHRRNTWILNDKRKLNAAILIFSLTKKSECEARRELKKIFGNQIINAIDITNEQMYE